MLGNLYISAIIHNICFWEKVKKFCCHRGVYQAIVERKTESAFAEVDEDCHATMEQLVEQMKAGGGIIEELKATNQMKWEDLMNNVRSAAEEVVIKELIYV